MVDEVQMSRVEIFSFDDLWFVDVEADAKTSRSRLGQRCVVIDPQIAFVPNEMYCHLCFALNTVSSYLLPFAIS